MYNGNPFANKSPRGQYPRWTQVCDAHDRITRVKEFTYTKCVAALEMKSLQSTVRKAVEVRLRKLAKQAAPVRGVCKRCGCTQTTPCIGRFGGTCAWADATQTLCTACCPQPKGKS